MTTNPAEGQIYGYRRQSSSSNGYSNSNGRPIDGFMLIEMSHAVLVPYTHYNRLYSGPAVLVGKNQDGKLEAISNPPSYVKRIDRTHLIPVSELDPNIVRLDDLHEVKDHLRRRLNEHHNTQQKIN